MSSHPSRTKTPPPHNPKQLNKSSSLKHGNLTKVLHSRDLEIIKLQTKLSTIQSENQLKTKMISNWENVITNRNRQNPHQSNKKLKPCWSATSSTTNIKSLKKNSSYNSKTSPLKQFKTSAEKLITATSKTMPLKQFKPSAEKLITGTSQTSPPKQSKPSKEKLINETSQTSPPKQSKPIKLEPTSPQPSNAEKIINEIHLSYKTQLNRKENKITELESELTASNSNYKSLLTFILDEINKNIKYVEQGFAPAMKWQTTTKTNELANKEIIKLNLYNFTKMIIDQRLKEDESLQLYNQINKTQKMQLEQLEMKFNENFNKNWKELETCLFAKQDEIAGLNKEWNEFKQRQFNIESDINNCFTEARNIINWYGYDKNMTAVVSTTPKQKLDKIGYALTSLYNTNLKLQNEIELKDIKNIEMNKKLRHITDENSRVSLENTAWRKEKEMNNATNTMIFNDKWNEIEREKNWWAQEIDIKNMQIKSLECWLQQRNNEIVCFNINSSPTGQWDSFKGKIISKERYKEIKHCNNQGSNTKKDYDLGKENMNAIESSFVANEKNERELNKLILKFGIGPTSPIYQGNRDNGFDKANNKQSWPGFLSQASSWNNSWIVTNNNPNNI